VPVFPVLIQEIAMSKSRDAKKSTLKVPQKTMAQKKQEKRDKKNKPKDYATS
jgi:hypothetical protein